MDENIGTAVQPPRSYDGPPPPGTTDGRGRRTLRGVGEALVTLGFVVLLFVFYELYVTGWAAAGRQADATEVLENQWNNGRGDGIGPAEGQGIARLYIPALGPDYQFTVIEGTGENDLATGPGHYVGTALPGQPGNFALAGHRVGKGAPFNDLDLVQSCDALVVETAHDWWVYRMLPKDTEVGGWATGRGRTPACAGADASLPVVPPTGAYQGLAGQQIVTPEQSEVIDPVPGRPDDAVPPAARAALITLTTCHPQFSDAQRLIVHGVLVKHYAKTPGGRPPELGETG